MTGNTKLPVAPKSKSPSRHPIFGSAPILPEEDSEAYDALLARVFADANPPDIIVEILLREAVDLTWEIKRWRKTKIDLVAQAMPAALRAKLANLISMRRSKTKEVSKEATLEEAMAAYGRLCKMSREEWLEEERRTATKPLEDELVKKWIKQNPAAIRRINKLLTSANTTMASVVATAFMEKFDDIERIDRLITIAERRRNALFREIDRHRTTFGPALRNKITEIDDAEFEVVERKTTGRGIVRGRNAA
jgi:hypothetical protein